MKRRLPCSDSSNNLIIAFFSCTTLQAAAVAPISLSCRLHLLVPTTVASHYYPVVLGVATYSYWIVVPSTYSLDSSLEATTMLFRHPLHNNNNWWVGAGASSAKWVVEKEGRTWKDTETEDSKKFNGILFECKSVQYIVFSVCHHIVLFWSCFCAIHQPTPFFLCSFVDILHTKRSVELNLTARFIIIKMLSNLKELRNLGFHPHKLDFYSLLSAKNII